MALRQRYDQQADIPAVVREHYSEKDGTWVLETDPATEDVTGLKTALSTERGLRREAEKQITELKVKFDGIDPEEVTKLKDRLKTFDDSEIYDKQGIEALVTKRTETMKSEHARVVASKDRELSQLKEAATSLEQRWRSDRVETALTSAASLAGVAKYALIDAVSRGKTVFSALDEEGTVLAKKGEDIVYGKDGITPLSPSEWYAAQRTENPHWFPPSSGGGAPALHGGNGTGVDYSKLPPEERLTAIRAARAAGRA